MESPNGDPGVLLVSFIVVMLLIGATVWAMRRR